MSFTGSIVVTEALDNIRSPFAHAGHASTARPERHSLCLRRLRTSADLEQSNVQAGKATCTASPPSAAERAVVTSAPCTAAMCLTIDQPSPLRRGRAKHAEEAFAQVRALLVAEARPAVLHAQQHLSRLARQRHLHARASPP